MTVVTRWKKPLLGNGMNVSFEDQEGRPGMSEVVQKVAEWSPMLEHNPVINLCRKFIL